MALLNFSCDAAVLCTLQTLLPSATVMVYIIALPGSDHVLYCSNLKADMCVYMCVRVCMCVWGGGHNTFTAGECVVPPAQLPAT